MHRLCAMRLRSTCVRLVAAPLRLGPACLPRVGVALACEQARDGPRRTDEVGAQRLVDEWATGEAAAMMRPQSGEGDV